MLKNNMVKYRLIEKHLDLVRHGEYGEARLILHLLDKHLVRVGLDDDGFMAEVTAQSCGCFVRYSRSYAAAVISF